MVDNLALLIAHLLLVMTIMRSLRADKAIQHENRLAWRDRAKRPPRRPG